MNKKLKQLREQTKRELGLFIKEYNWRVHPKWAEGSMIAHYRECSRILSKIRLRPDSNKMMQIPIYAKMTNFVRAGDIYYHAKKYGVESAILYKLSLQ